MMIIGIISLYIYIYVVYGHFYVITLISSVAVKCHLKMCAVLNLIHTSCCTSLLLTFNL